MKYLTIVIPAYNEKKLLKSSLDKIVSFLSSKKYSWNIIVVNDGSCDKTAAIVRKYKNKNINILTFKKNMGKGAALRKGMIQSKSKYVVYMDADLSVPIGFIDDMLKELESGKKVVVGSRRITKSIIAKHQSFFREKMGVVFTWLTRLVTGVGLNDFTCGFKGFETKAAHKIFSKSVVDRWAYDAEIMFIAKKYGYDIEQIPVTWINREESRVRVGSAAITSFIDLIKVRINGYRGVYD